MPRKPQRVSSYPPQFRRLVEEAEKVREFEFKCLKEQKVTMRTSLAKFLKAIRVESEEWIQKKREGKVEAKEEDPWFYGFYDWASKTSIGETPEGIRFYPRNEGKIAMMLEEVLIAQGLKSTEETIATDGEALMARLMKIQEKADEARAARAACKIDLDGKTKRPIEAVKDISEAQGQKAPQYYNEDGTMKSPEELREGYEKG